MQVSDILEPERVRFEVEATSKKRALEIVSELLTQNTEDSPTSHAIFDCLIARERLGSTGLGEGVALPHGRMPNLDRAMGAFIRIKEGIDFDAPDGQPVDLVFGLLVPENSTDEHLQILSRLAELFHEEALRQKLRSPSSGQEAFELLTQAVTQT